MIVKINDVKASNDDVVILLHDLQNNNRTIDNITQKNNTIIIYTSEAKKQF